MEGMRGFVARHAAALDPRAHALRRARVRRRPGADRARGRGHAADARLHAGDARLARRVRRARRPPAAPRAALRLRHRRADRAQGAATRPRCWPSIDEYKMAANYHSQRDVAANLDLGTVAACVDVCLEAVRSLSRRRSSRARLSASSRVAISPAKRSSSSWASSSPSRGPGWMPSSRASSSPRTSGAGGPAARRSSAGPSISRASSRCAAIAGSALRPRVASRSATVKTVTSARTGSVASQVAPDRAPVERPLVDEEAEPQVVQAQRGDVVGELLGRAQPAQHRAGDLRPLAVVAGEADAGRPGRCASASAAWPRRAAARRSASPRRA